MNELRLKYFYEGLCHEGNGGFGDILLVKDDPLKDISILTKPKENLARIMKDGKIHKNTIK